MHHKYIKTCFRNVHKRVQKVPVQRLWKAVFLAFRFESAQEVRVRQTKAIHVSHRGMPPQMCEEGEFEAAHTSST